MAKFVIFLDIALQYRWRLIAANGEIVAASEAYTRKYSAIVSAKRVREIAYVADIVDTTK